MRSSLFLLDECEDAKKCLKTGGIQLKKLWNIWVLSVIHFTNGLLTNKCWLTKLADYGRSKINESDQWIREGEVAKK